MEYVDNTIFLGINEGMLEEMLKEIGTVFSGRSLTGNPAKIELSTFEMSGNEEDRGTAT